MDFREFCMHKLNVWERPEKQNKDGAAQFFFLCNTWMLKIFGGENCK